MIRITSVKARRQTIYWDLEPEFLYDYLFFASSLRFWQASENTYEKYQLQQQGKGICLVNLFETYQKSLEDLGAVVLALRRRFNYDPNCKYQKGFSVQETPVTYTLINYKPGESTIKSVLGDADQEIEKNLNLQIVNRINITLVYPNFDYTSWKNDFILNLKSLARDQDKRLRMFNKIKHGGVVISNAKILKSSQPLGPAVIYSNPDKTSADSLVLHSFKYVEEEFVLIKRRIMDVRKIIRELITIYLIKQYPDFIKNKGLSSALELLKKVEK